MLPSCAWQALLASRVNGHVTRTAVFKLPANWEADWKRARNTASASAVANDLLSILPEVLRRAWQCLPDGGQAEVQAPEDFWEHPFAVLFHACKVPLHHN